jgi:branched-chain amino acid transport system permease protein
MSAISSTASGPMARLRATLSDRDGQKRVTLVLIVVTMLYGLGYNDLRQGPLQPLFEALPLPSVNVLIVMFYYAIMALGLNIVVGFAGLLDLGYVAFYVFGAYTTAWLASPLHGIHVPWWFVVIAAVAVAAGAGVLLGAPTLRLRGDYLAIVTLGFGEIMPVLARNLDDIDLSSFGGPAHFNLTGGNIGVNPIDPPILPIPGPWGDQLVFSNGNPVASMYLILALLLLVFAICVRLRDSRLGRAWMAIREDETAAASMGIDTVSTKLLAFGLGASFSGFTGAFFGAYSTAIFPESFNFAVSISILIMIILGGMGSIRGVILGAFVIRYVNDSLLPYLGGFVDEPIRALGAALPEIPILKERVESFTLTSYNYLLYGVILVVMMIKRPEGFLPAAARKAELHGEGISSDVTFGTSGEVAEAATHFEEQAGHLEIPEAAPDATDDPATGDRP